MVVNYKETGWEVITQRAHGLLAAQIGMQWRVKDRPQRWMETLLAIAEHDDAEIELDGETLVTETGGPLNFSMKTFDLAHCEKLAMLTQAKSRYIALLISMHMEFLYHKEEKGNKIVSRFLAEQRGLQKLWRNELGLQPEELKKIYSLLEWCDALSLLLCQFQVQPEKRAIEISTGPDKKQYHLSQINEKTLTIDPWPFEATTFTVYFESREITQLQFKNSAAFRKAFLAASVKETSLQLSRKPKNHHSPEKVPSQSL